MAKPDGGRRGPSAAEHYARAFATFADFDGDPELYSAAQHGDPAALRDPTITAWIEANAAALDAFQRAAKCGGSGWEYSGKPPQDMIGELMPRLGKLRGLSRLALIAGQRDAMRGEPSARLAAALDVAASGSHAGQGLTVIEGLVGCAMQSLAFRTVLDCLDDPSHPEIDFAQLAQRLDDDRAIRPFDEVVRGEQVLGFAMFQDMLPAGPFYEQTVAEAIVFYDALTAVVELPYPQAHELFGELTAYAKDERSNPLLANLSPSLQRTFVLHTGWRTQRNGVRLVAHLMAYHKEHGRYPDALDVFDDREFAIDPFAEQSFVYRVTDDGFVLYSVGADGRDDGGRSVSRVTDEGGDVLIWPPER